MKGKWLGIALAAALLSAGCGEGRAIFNVDVLSFIPAPDRDTPYTVPPTAGVPVTIDSLVVEVPLFEGLENSIVDTVMVSGLAELQNTTGAGTVTFEVFFASVATTLFSGSPALSVSGTVSPGNTTLLPLSAELSAAFRDIFKQATLFVGIRATLNNPGLTDVTGRLVLTTLDVRLVLQDRVY